MAKGLCSGNYSVRMQRHARHVLTIAVGTTLGIFACRSEPVDTQALLTAHSLGLNDLRRGQLG